MEQQIAHTDLHKARTLILEKEKELLKAFTSCDIDTIDELLHNDVVYIIPNGRLLTKARVLQNYSSGGTAISSIRSEEQSVHFVDDCAVVAMILHLSGKYYDQVVDRKFRYLRVWKLLDGHWKVITISSVPIIE